VPVSNARGSNKSILTKQQNTNIERYGVPNVNQSSIIQAKSQKKGLRYKDFKCPSGAIRKIQGYEHFALDYLFTHASYDELDIITDRGTIPRISYVLNETTHYYYPDIFIQSENKLIEVKSDWTYKKSKDVNHLKGNAAVASGYLFEIWIFSRTGERTIIVFSQ